MEEQDSVARDDDGCCSLHTLGRPPRYEQFPSQSLVTARSRTCSRASLKPIDTMASGSHYASRELLVSAAQTAWASQRRATRGFGEREPLRCMAQRAVCRAFSFLVPKVWMMRPPPPCQPRRLRLAVACVPRKADAGRNVLFSVRRRNGKLAVR